MQRDKETSAAVEGDGDAAVPIAAFAVSKGGVVIKHIFLNAPPPELTKTRGDGADAEEEEEDPPVTVGRHPDCHVLVDHPSVSRFHLELRARRQQRRITVTDLSSVHGTWVSGRRIPPNTPVDLAAGDTLRLGASRREYRLLWLSLREAFEMEGPLPPLVEEDKEEARCFQTVQESSDQMVPGQRDLVDINTHKDTSQKFVTEIIPSAPPLPEFTQSFYQEQFALSQFLENSEDVTNKKLVDKSPVSESFGSLIIKDMPATVTNASRPVQLAKQDDSSQVSKRAKLKSVKSLRIDTGRNRDTSSTLSYSCQKEDQSDIVVCSQNCGIQCAACIALLGISEFKGTYQKEMTAEEKGHMNPPASITMEGNKKEPTNSESFIPQDSADDKSENTLPEVKLNGLSTPNFEGTKNLDSKEFQDRAEINPLDKEIIAPYFSESTSVPEVKLSGLSTLSEGSISNSENMAPNKIAEGPKDCQLEGTICWNLFGDLDAEVSQDNEEISSLDKENITPYVSGNIVMERSDIGLKPTISQELMDSISPLHLEHDIFSEKENSMLNIANEMRSNESTSGNLSPLISADTKMQQNQVEFIPISRLEFKDGILSNSKSSALAPGNYDAISPVRQEDLFSDKENVTPASRDRKPIVRRVLGSRMDDSVSAESKDFHTVDDDVFYSDKENLTPLSSQGMKARKSLPKNIFVDAHQDQEAFFSDKENLTPLSSAARKTRDMSENRAQIESAITKKRVVDRLPFQTLLSNSPLRPTSSLGCKCAVARAAAAAGDLGIKLEDEFENLSRNHQESGRTVLEMKAWTMVADTDSLLDDESRKSIMLLKGIKGTQLIIPRIVIRELDSMKQREGLFRRSSKATSILKWIDECMENESWWIHVQSSSEMFPVAPTPPATPSAQCVDEEIKIGSRSFNPMALFYPRSFADIESPKPEDRVLDCALVFKKLRSNQNMVILSDSITLKIKAMAEGLLCEGGKEFRESLMNPCSDRFMWAGSVPRGWAWSSLDEATLAQNYYNSHHHERRKRAPTPRTLESAAKGLKLILRHNSVFAQAASPAPLASA